MNTNIPFTGIGAGVGVTGRPIRPEDLANCAYREPKQLSILDDIGVTGEAVGSLMNALNQLAERLQPVLRTIPEQANTKNAPRVPRETQIQEAIHDIRDRVDCASCLARDLMARLAI